VLVGKVGEEKSEIKEITGAVTAGTSLTVVALTFNHDIDTPVTKVDFDQVEFSHATTATGTKTALATSNMNPADIFTYYEDAANTTGYGFIRYHDSVQTTSYSVYSDPIPYTGYTKRMLRQMRKKVRRLLNETDEVNSSITNEEIDDELNNAQTELGQSRMWTVLEDTKSLSTVADRYEYDLASSVLTLYEAKFDTQPLAVIDLHKWNILRWNSDTTGDPTKICMWGRKARVHPHPSESADTTTLNGAISSVTATTITVVSTAGFRTQGRIIIDSEVISYTGTTSTTFTGCTRGEEGTTAATHLTAVTVTERDVIYHYQKDPDDLTDETDETPFLNPNAIIYKASSELAQDETTKDKMLVKYDRAVKSLEKSDQSKYKSTFGRVKHTMEVDVGSIYPDQNTYPLE
jgi:hypothetical protein